MTTPPSFNPQPCCDGAGDAPCGQPVQFCQNSSTTGPVEHPGRQYDITLPINQGFAVDQLLVDATTHNAGITWSVLDSDGSDFAEELRVFLEGRLPAAAVVTITNPNENQEVCGDAQPFQIHIECLRLDEDPPNLIELVYNAGSDKILNPAYRPLNSFTSTATRQDNGGNILCTSVANRGWETNDQLQAFEFWGPANAAPAGENPLTPTPRGTPVQEINANGSGLPSPNSGDTIWQTFEVTPAEAGSTFNIRVVVGGRNGTEAIRIRMFAGDEPNPGTAPGGLIDTTLMAPDVTNPDRNPWTNYSNSLPLGPGLYTLAFTGPDTTSIGGLFTDMRAFIDRPGRRATATTDDETCVVTVDETTTNTVCSFWSPVCSNGQIESWTNVETQTTLTNDEFWAQTPSPTCCLPQATEGGGGGGGQSNMAVSDVVCATVGGIPQNAIRTVVLDPSGGQLTEEFLSTDGTRITPASWQPGQCTTLRYLADVVLCDTDPVTGDVTTSFLRKYVQTWSQEDGARVVQTRDFTLDGTQVYTPTGVVRECNSAQSQVDQEVVCWTQTSTGSQVHTGTMRHEDRLTGPATPGWALFDQHENLVAATEPGLTFVSCAQAMDPVAVTGLCLADGTPIATVTRRNSVTGAMAQDGWINLTTGAFTAGNPPVGTVACGESRSIQVSGTFCDVDTNGDVQGLVLIEYTYAPDGTIASVRLVDATTGATYTPVGEITVCPTGTDTGPEQDIEVLCDVNAGVSTPFVRDYRRDETGAITAVSNYTLAGAAYTPTGTVGVCTGRDSESVILCDSATPNPNRFLRTYTYTGTGAVAGFTDTTFAGAAFTPTGAVGVCATTVQSDTDFVEEVMSDANGTCFLRLFRFNSVTGALISTTNTTLAGAAFTPVGAVTAGCQTCCPQVIGEGCSNTGSGRYAALRGANGTITLVDSVSGATVTPAQVVACADDDVAVSLQTRAFDVLPGTPWTPALATGTITSLTATGIAGTWTLTPPEGAAVAGLPAGYTATYNAEDNNQIQPPTSIAADAASRVVVVWTER